jgi:transcriptional regulator GlxA family with amidase domain
VLTAANTIWARSNPGQRGLAPLFEWRIESPDGKPVRTASGQLLHVDGAINGRTAADAVLVTAPFVIDTPPFASPATLAPLVAALRSQHHRGALLASYCSGSFVLAETGLLDGGVATTHWVLARLFAQRYPQIELRAAEVLTEHDRILCSGAVTTYLNLALRLVEKLAGSRLATTTAKMLLIDLNRVSQASYAMLTVQDQQGHADALVAKAQRWMERHLDRAFDLPALARHLGASARTVNRRFHHAVGAPPLQHLQAMRIEVAKRLLETTPLHVDEVSARVGYGDLSTFRRLFKRTTGLSPRDHQRQFARRTGVAVSPR